MLSLETVGRRFEVPLKIIGGGSGVVYAVISEADQTQIPSYVFVPPRHLVRLRYPTALHPRHVVQTPTGMRFIVGDNGPSEQVEGVLWQSFRLFQVTHDVRWVRRGKTLDPVTKLMREGAPVDMGLIPVAIEPTDREENDRHLSTSAEQARYIAAAMIHSDDMLGDYRANRADEVLGVTIGMLTY